MSMSVPVCSFWRQSGFLELVARTVVFDHCIGQVFPDLGNLLDAIRPNGILSLEVGMILVGVKDHGDGSLITEGFITLPFDERIALSRGSFRSGTRSARGLTLRFVKWMLAWSRKHTAEARI